MVDTAQQGRAMVFSISNMCAQVSRARVGDFVGLMKIFSFFQSASHALSPACSCPNPLDGWNIDSCTDTLIEMSRKCA